MNARSVIALKPTNPKIATLRAQVARREAELESLTLLGLQGETAGGDTSVVADLPQLSKKDARMLRADLDERRRNLGLEVQQLNAEVRLSLGLNHLQSISSDTVK